MLKNQTRYMNDDMQSVQGRIKELELLVAEEKKATEK